MKVKLKLFNKRSDYSLWVFFFLKLIKGIYFAPPLSSVTVMSLSSPELWRSAPDYDPATRVIKGTLTLLSLDVKQISVLKKKKLSSEIRYKATHHF